MFRKRKSRSYEKIYLAKMMKDKADKKNLKVLVFFSYILLIVLGVVFILWLGI
jgi:hypothetical protein